MREIICKCIHAIGVEAVSHDGLQQASDDIIRANERLKES